MGRRVSGFTMVSALLIAALWLAPDAAYAIPAFARAYAVPCSTCHDTIPVRNDFGEVFRRSGYRWPGELATDATARKPPPVDMLGIGALDAKLPAVIPIALVGTMGATYSDADDAQHQPVKLGSPSLKIMLGSALGEHLAVFGDWQTGNGAPSRLFFHVTRILNRHELNLVVGRFEPTTTLLRANDSYFDTFGLSGAPLNGHILGQGRNGLELNGALFKHAFYAAGIVQNSGGDSSYDAYYHLSVKLGGVDWTGNEPDVDLENTSWLDDVIVELSQWGYKGRSGDAAAAGYELERLGGDLKITFQRFRARSGIMLGHDRDRRVDLPTRSLTSTSEASFAITSWLRLAGQVDVQDTASQRRTFVQYQGGLLGLLLENVRIRLAAGYTPTDDTFLLGLHILAGI